MIFNGHEPGFKGYQFWDTASWHFEISCDVKFEESRFPAKEKSLAQPGLAPLSDCQFQNKLSQEDSDNDLGLVILNQPPPDPTSPG